MFLIQTGNTAEPSRSISCTCTLEAPRLHARKQPQLQQLLCLQKTLLKTAVYRVRQSCSRLAASLVTAQQLACQVMLTPIMNAPSQEGRGLQPDLSNLTAALIVAFLGLKKLNTTVRAVLEQYHLSSVPLCSWIVLFMLLLLTDGSASLL